MQFSHYTGSTCLVSMQFSPHIGAQSLVNMQLQFSMCQGVSYRHERDPKSKTAEQKSHWNPKRSSRHVQTESLRV